MNRVSVSITNFGIQWDDCFVALSIPKALQEQIDEVEAALDASSSSDLPSTSSTATIELCPPSFEGRW